MQDAPAISTLARSATIDRLEREHFDCVVIGGGITGAGIAREASLRGLSVALLEAEDFGSGSSSRSSKLIHGGLRYLAMGDVALVRSTALERKEIFRLAPHLAERRWLVVPTRSRAGLFKVRAGITTYEKLGAVEGEDLHRNWSRRDLEREEPLIDRSTYKYACVYREYLTDDAHLVLANLRAAVACDAAVLNHTPVDAIVQDAGIARGVQAACRLSGRRFEVRGRCVINAAGPWVEAVRRLEDPSAASLLHLSKGVHICLRAERLPVSNMMIVNTQDRRSVFVIPHGRVVYVGTTDTTYRPGYEVWPAIELEDVEYLLEPLDRFFRVDPIGPDEVVAAWAGLRPLIAQPGKKPQELSRREEVLVGASRMVSVAGGKLTGYRPMAREALECAAESCDLRLPPRPDEEPPLPGGDFDGDLAALAARVVLETGVSRECAERMVRIYGTETETVLALGASPLAPGSDAVLGEVDWAIEREGAATAEDVLYRRTRTALYDPDARESAVGPVVSRMAERLGWSEMQRQEQAAQVHARIAADLAFASDAKAA